MIFGRVKVEILEYVGHRQWFAWYPVKLDDGRWLWLEKVWIKEYHHWGGTDKEYFLLGDKK